MQLTQPPYIHFDPDEKRTLKFLWDDARCSRDFTHDAGWLLRATSGLTLRARMALCVVLYEWTVWRFDGLHEDEQPLQILEAAWCATAHPARMQYFELERQAWLGPIRGPLWCGATWLRPAVAEADRQPFQVLDGLSYLTRLALHVHPQPHELKQWLQAVLPRLAALYPLQPHAPWDDLFDRQLIERRGPLVAPEAFDLRRPYVVEDGEPLMQRLLGEAHAERNEFLAKDAQLD